MVKRRWRLALEPAAAVMVLHKSSIRRTEAAKIKQLLELRKSATETYWLQVEHQGEWYNARFK